MSRLFLKVSFVLAFCLLTIVARGEEPAQPLRFYDDVKKQFIQAPGIATDIQTRVEGTIARTTVTQYFLNDTSQWQAGIYQFPLPDDAAVDSLTMMIGERRVIGFVTEKEQAKEIYETAKAKGQGAGLVDQHRLNLFKTSVANIPPRSLIGIEIEYQNDVRLDGQLFSLRIPLAVTPRYERISGDEFRHMVAAAEQGWAEDIVDRLALSNFKGGSNPVSIDVTLRPGFRAGVLESGSHNVDIRESEKGLDRSDAYEITLADKVTPGNRDFTLNWAPAEWGEPYQALYTEERKDNFYSHLLIMPARASGEVVDQLPASKLKRHVTYIIDVSGSMDGPSISQAKKSLATALDDLGEQDFFNIIAFSDSYRKIFPEPVTAAGRHVELAKAAVADLVVGGGTEMMPALIEAFIEPDVDGHLRQIVFITDGAISYEVQLTAKIKKLVGDARFFAIGIGAAPNAHLMRHIAMAGRGTYTFIDDVNMVERELSALFDKMKAPVLTDFELDLPEGAEAEVFPARLPDLMAGEPVSVAIKSAVPLNSLGIKGQRGDQAWYQTVALDQPRSAEGISKIFARRKIEALTFDRLGMDDQNAEREIIEIAIRHQLISAHTSLVAVDEAILRPEQDRLVEKRYDPTLPAGWQEDRLTALEAADAYRGLLERTPAEDLENESFNQLKQQINLPQTATGHQLYLVLGFTMMLVASGLLVARRRGQHA